ncbi:ABC transporter ATP-binding protein [Solwaraspora sp. WMMB335]|uniref:ABC transporter ATP-binding protein n=1 Tax=Solwaraspora sp. WMMB335 TaxID=3404118 RepID=UPI003B949D11
MSYKLEGRSLGKTFTRRDSALTVLEDVSIAVRPGEFVSIIGASGCGKTTLLRMLHGLIAPTTGEVLIDGERIDGPTRQRGFVLQQASLLPWRTVLDNVTFGMELDHLPGAQAKARARELIKLVGLTGFESHYPSEISGGMQQRVNIARALAIEPDILFMDEPFAAVDAQTREVMQAELLRIWDLDRKTVVFVTHQLDEAVYLSDRVIVLGARPGRVREILTIDLPRPRTLAVKRSHEFADYVDRVWKLIENEVVSGDESPAAASA